MTRRKPRPGMHQLRPDRRDRALLFDIVTRGNRFDDFDVGLVIGLGQLKWDNRVGSGRQGIAGSDANQWQPDWIVGTGP